MSRFIPVHSRFSNPMPLDFTGRYIVTDVPPAAHLSATRRAREGKFVGALGIRARNFGAQLRPKSGQFHLLPHIQTPYLTSTSISSPFCRSRWTIGEVESLRLGGGCRRDRFGWALKERWRQEDEEGG